MDRRFLLPNVRMLKIQNILVKFMCLFKIGGASLIQHLRVNKKRRGQHYSGENNMQCMSWIELVWYDYYYYYYNSYSYTQCLHSHSSHSITNTFNTYYSAKWHGTISVWCNLKHHAVFYNTTLPHTHTHTFCHYLFILIIFIFSPIYLCMFVFFFFLGSVFMLPRVHFLWLYDVTHFKVFSYNFINVVNEGKTKPGYMEMETEKKKKNYDDENGLEWEIKCS